MGGESGINLSISNLHLHYPKISHSQQQRFIFKTLQTFLGITILSSNEIQIQAIGFLLILLLLF